MTELIFRYVGSEEDTAAAIRAALPDDRAALLLNQYGIIRLEEDQIETFKGLDFLVYIEAAQALYYSSLRSQADIAFPMDFPETDPLKLSSGDRLHFRTQALSASDLNEAYYNLSAACFPSGEERVGLNGQGVLLCVIDSGIDYRHPEFLTPDGRTRILAYWDQSAAGEFRYQSLADDSVYIDNNISFDLQGTATSPGLSNLSMGLRYLSGIVYSENEINEALAAGTLQGSRLVPATDLSGHGTAVASVCGGSNIGAAPGASFLVVKLGNPIAGGFPRTSELMQGIDFCVRESIRLRMPAVINLSFGNSYGSHLGTSLLETYIDSLDGVGKTVFVTGTGNEGAAGGHKAVHITRNSNQNLNESEFSENIQLSVAESTPNLNIQIWKNFADVVEIRLIAPTGESFLFQEGMSGSYMAGIRSTDRSSFDTAYTGFSTGTNPSSAGSAPSGSDGNSFDASDDRTNSSLDASGVRTNSSLDASDDRTNSSPDASDGRTDSPFETRINYVFHLPSYYQSAQELYLSLEPAGSSWYILPGIWQIAFTPVRVTDGTVHLWLPGESARNTGTAFPEPTPFGTFTIPSTASKIISVGAYRASDDSYADFSGRGFENYLSYTCKPDLAAPGADVLCAMPGGGYLTGSGTSLAAPFVSGACALLMQWGIVMGHDPFLYGEKVKAYLRRGARPLPAYREYPNPYVGYGKLCVRDSIYSSSRFS